MATVEERISRVEGIIPHLATKEDIAELRGEMRALRWLMSGIGVAFTALTLILKYLG